MFCADSETESEAETDGSSTYETGKSKARAKTKPSTPKRQSQEQKDIESSQSLEDDGSALEGGLDAVQVTSTLKNDDRPAEGNGGNDRERGKSLAAAPMVEGDRSLGLDETAAGLQRKEKSESQSAPMDKGRSAVQESSHFRTPRKTAHAVTVQDISIVVSDSTGLPASNSKDMTPERRTRGILCDIPSSLPGNCTCHLQILLLTLPACHLHA